MLKIAAALVPYAAVLIGMYVLHNAWATILFYHLGIAVFIFRRNSSSLWKTLWAGWRTPLLIPGVIVCALAAPVVYFMWPFFQPLENVLPEWLAQYGLTGWAWLLLIPYFSIIHPILEEIHWRGIAPERFVPICWQDLFFAGYHVLVLYQLIYWPWLFLIFAILTASAIFWRWTSAQFGGYAISIATHATADAAVLIGVLFLLR